MENQAQTQSPKPQEYNQFLKSPNSTTSSTSSTSNPTTPRTITRSEPNNPYPTTFVQADSTSFKQVVQMLTGSVTTQAQKQEPKNFAKNPIPPIRPGPNKKPGSKLYERRNSQKNFKISTLLPGYSARPEILSPSILDFPSLALSPVTPLIPDPFNRGTIDMVAEEQAISKKGFYLHPSPRGESEPRLLPLFPVISPRVAGSSS